MVRPTIRLKSAGRQRPLQQTHLAAHDQPFEPVIDDVAGNRMFIFAGRRNEQMGNRGEPFERQLLPRRRMIGANHPDPRLAEQRFAVEPFGDAAETADRQSARPASSASVTPILLGRILNSAFGAAALSRAIRLGTRTVPTYSPQIMVNRRSVCAGTKSVGVSAQLEVKQALAQPRRHLGRARGRLHPIGAADEQLVFEHIAQPVQRMADRRLGQAEPVAGAGNAAFLDEGVENPQQIEIERVKMNYVHGCDAILSFVQFISDAYV